MKVTCKQCGKETDKPASHVNRSLKRGAPLYCSMSCSALGRRIDRSDDEKKELKRIYDQGYRESNLELLKEKKQDWHKRTYDPEKAAVYRKANMQRHVEYCRRPEYAAWKKEYDRKYRAKVKYGEYWECFMLTQDIREEALTLMSDYEIRLSKGTLNKALKRKRDYERLNSGKPEISPLGNFELSQGRQDGARTG